MKLVRESSAVTVTVEPGSPDGFVRRCSILISNKNPPIGLIPEVSSKEAENAIHRLFRHPPSRAGAENGCKALTGRLTNSYIYATGQLL